MKVIMGHQKEKKLQIYDSSETYVTKQAHWILADKMMKRDPASAPTVGDRVPYVIVKGSQSTHIFDNAEDPILALEKNLPIDFNYYLNKQLRKPLLRIFTVILKNPEALFMGHHTKK